MPGPAGLGVGVGHEADPVRGRDLGDQVGDVVAEGVGVAEPEDGVGDGPGPGLAQGVDHVAAGAGVLGARVVRPVVAVAAPDHGAMLQNYYVSQRRL